MALILHTATYVLNGIMRALSLTDGEVFVKFRDKT